MTFNDLEWIEFEISRLCNAACPLCARTEILQDPDLPNFPLDYISLKQIEKIFAGYDLTGKNFRFNGNVGDPMTNPDLIPIIKLLLSKSKGNNIIDINTNGGIRSRNFWMELGNISKTAKNNEIKLRVTFAVDGLEDTNHLYRINVDFDKVIENIGIYVKEGGYAIWAFIIFDHNSHQIDEVKSLAKQVGCKQFITVKNTRRSIPYNNAKRSKQIVKPSITKPYKNFAKEINCQLYHNKTLYILGGLTVWPCCNLYDSFWRQDELFLNTISEYDKDFNNLNVHSLEEIIKSDWISNLPKRWNQKNKNYTNRCIKDCKTVQNPIITRNWKNI